MMIRLHKTDQLPFAHNRASIVICFRDPGADELIASALQRAVNKENLDDTARHFDAYRRDLLAFLRSRVSSPENAEDLLQQVFLRVMQRGDWRKVRNPEAYLRTTARHVLSDFYRSQNARDHGVVLEYREFEDADDNWSPGGALKTREFMSELITVLESLSPQVRKSLVLSRVYGYTYAEIGRELSISSRTVEKHVAKGLARCIEHFADANDDPSNVEGGVE